MAKNINGDYLKNISLTCQKCKGTCFDKDQPTRQANVRKTFGSALPNACVDSAIDGHKCPYQP